MTVPAPAQAVTDPAAAPATPPATPPAAPTPPAPAPAPSAAPTTDAVAKLQSDLDAANQRAAQMQAEARKHEDRWKQRDGQLDEQQKTLKLLADKMGVQIDDKPDAGKLAEQVTQYQSTARQAATELAVFRAAQAAGADANALLDSRAFMAKTSGLDSSAADFADQVKAIVASQIVANPSLAAQQPAKAPDAPPAPQQPAVTPLPASSGPVVTAPSVTGQQWTEADLDAASPQQVSDAIKQGLLANIGIGKPRQSRNR
ncbi:MAG TPA: hypothetical protein VHX38_18730 [Pseudonocardiaceae bacterium]|jgi:hypothetical protein|nr:hypothetical protein [Pseudonocardiaceae bacterium]